MEETLRPCARRCSTSEAGCRPCRTTGWCCRATPTNWQTGACLTTSSADVLSGNEAMAALDSDEAWAALPFLAFDDALARRARDQS